MTETAPRFDKVAAAFSARVEAVPARHLKLISARPFKTGVVHLVYAPNPNLPNRNPTTRRSRASRRSDRRTT